MTVYQYEPTDANVEARNATVRYDSDGGVVVVEFELRGHDWDTGDANVPQAKFYYDDGGYNLVITQDLTPNDNWTAVQLQWPAHEDLALDTYSLGTKLEVLDEGGKEALSEEFAKITVDLDPSGDINVEWPPSFGYDNTPIFRWTMSNLLRQQTMTPVLHRSVDSDFSTEYTDDVLSVKINDSWVVIGDGGIANINGVPLEDLTTLTMGATDAYMGELQEFRIPSTEAITEEYYWYIDLACADIT